MVKTALLLPLVLGMAVTSLYAQLPTPCTFSSQVSGACEDACIFCNFDGYVGTTINGDSDGGDSIDFCGTLENAQWIGFIANTSTATFTATPFFCNDSNGVQIALYSDCKSAPLACNVGKQYGGITPVSVTVSDLNPGSNYFLLVDGYAGDLCNFTIEVTPDDAVYEPALGMVGAITGPTELCSGATFQFSVAPVSGAGAYIWDGPPGTLVNGDSVPVAALAPGGAIVQITVGTQSGPICVQAANSCKQNPPCASSHQVNILPDTYRPAITMEKPQSLNCTEQPAQLAVSIDPPATYRYDWVSDSAGHIVAGANKLNAKVDSVGLYTLTVTNQINGCSSTDSVEVTEPRIPDNAAMYIRHISCYGNKDGLLRVDSVMNGQEPYVYSLDGKAFNVDPTIRYLEPGDHNLTIQGANGCEWDTTFTMLEPAELLVVLDPDTTLHLGQSFEVWNDANVNYPDRVKQTTVTPPELDSLLCIGCVFVPDHSFRYRVTIVDSNGCRATDDRLIVVNKERYVYVPNVFHPDSDSDGNDYFTIYGGEDVDRVLYLRVYNRWGKPVFENRDFQPNDLFSGWDGRISGDQAIPEVFVYETEILFKDGETVLYRGDVTLVR
ncbi:MAG: gliding motility-associated C-terminal domain-containing protein [Saprospiraceae bacterium]|nr:gliding motility-associated C-terminal domain-containing protein [Saprospiraceae bacterium]